jgi:hypothetical protein
MNLPKIIFYIFSLSLTTSIFADQAEYSYIPPNKIYYESEKNDNASSKKLSRIVSPDKKWIAFVKKSHRIIPNNCAAFADTGSNYANEIWIYNSKTKNKRLLVANNFSCDHLYKEIIDPKNLQFSPDSKTVYFITSARPTSSAVHSVDVDGKNLRFVTDGNEYHIVQHGKYKGDLIVNQHRYRLHPMGSYDWDWLFTPQGNQIKLYKKES